MKRKRKPPKRRSAAAKALGDRKYRQRVVPGKKRRAPDWRRTESP